jgi:alanine racemase
MQAARAIIHLDNLRRNILAARNKIGPHPKICFPVKADAYGHGVVPVSRCALEAGVEYLAVATLSEGMEIRAAGINAPIMLLSQTLPEDLPDIASHEFIIFVSDDEFIKEASRAAEKAEKKLTVHLKVDTGMGRLGCRPEDAASLARRIASRPGLSLGGIATHLSVADSPAPDHIAYTKGQLRRFREAVDSVKETDIDPGIVHAANSGALVFHEDSYLDMIRPGIFLYGYMPQGAPPGLSAEPLMEFRSKVVLVKRLKAGESASYGNIWTADEDTFIGVIPGGYADGIRRGLSNNHSVLIRGKACPLVGRICMDQFMVNLGPETEVRRWDEAVIFGPGFITAGDIAEKLATIPYEITCGINKRVPRVYVG